jgi:hypothetical protein
VFLRKRKKSEKRRRRSDRQDWLIAQHRTPGSNVFLKSNCFFEQLHCFSTVHPAILDYNVTLLKCDVTSFFETRLSNSEQSDLKRLREEADKARKRRIC